MSYMEIRFCHVTVVLNYGLHSAEISDLVKQYNGEFLGLEEDNSRILSFDFCDRKTYENDARDFIREVRDKFGRTVERIVKYNDVRYED